MEKFEFKFFLPHPPRRGVLKKRKNQALQNVGPERVKKHDLRQSAKIKDDIWKAKTTYVKIYIMDRFDFENMNKSKKSNLFYDFEF